MATTGKDLVKLEEELQRVMKGLQRFQSATETLEQGRQSIEETAEHVQELINQAQHSLQPALDAVAALRRLNPDTLLGQVTEAANAVKQQLDRIERQYSAELERTRQSAEKAAGEVQQVSKELPTSFGKVMAAMERVESSVSANRTLLLLASGLGVINVALLVILLMR